MKILVANLGSTSFKYRLFDMTDERELARGSVERIGPGSAVPDHAAAVRHCLGELVERRHLSASSDLAAIGFKAVHARGISGVQCIDEKVLAAMEAYNDVAPAHNPPYVRAMRLLAERFPTMPLVAAFETGFHESIAAKNRLYAVPLDWAENGIVRWGFHGASHRYIAERMSKLLKNAYAKIISCHLGGSSSLCAISAGMSQANSLGFSPQTGLPHNNRVGDFDPFAIPVIMRATGKTMAQVLDDLANRSGLFGLCGSNDLRAIEKDAKNGDPISQQAIDVYVASIRHYLGAYLVLLNGADAIVFTGGVGENSATIRAATCANLDWFGIYLDPIRNEDAKGEVPIHSTNSRTQIWTMPTNEELIVARQTREFVTKERN